MLLEDETNDTQHDPNTLATDTTYLAEKKIPSNLQHYLEI